MSRSLHVFNALLALVAVALGTAAVRTVLDGLPAAVAPPAAPGAAVATTATAEPVGLKLNDASAAEPDILLRGHPFGKPLPVPAVPQRPEPNPVGAAPPVPLPTLIGTLRVGDESRALLKDSSRTDLFAVGDALAGGTLVEIHTDRVVIKRGETLGEVALKSSIKAAPSPATPEWAPASEPAEPRRRRQRPGRPPATAPPPAAATEGR
jgi:Type II secretion system protein C